MENKKHSLENNIKIESENNNDNDSKRAKITFEDLIKTRILWTRQFQPYSINALEVGKIFLKKKSEMAIVIGIDSTLKIIQNQNAIVCIMCIYIYICINVQIYI